MYRKALFLLVFLALALTACRINTPPVIDQFTATPTTGTTPLTVTFSYSATDPDGDVLNCYMNYGDGVNQAVSCLARSVTHTYQVGSFTATLTVSDGRGGVTSASRTISVSPLSGACPAPSTLSLAAAQAAEPEEEPEGVSSFDGLAYKPGELLVYSPPLSLQSLDAQALEKQLSVQKLADLSLPGWRLYRVPEGMEKEKAREIVAAGLGRYAQPNYKYKQLYTPNDTYYATTVTSAYGSASQSIQFGLMEIPTAWDEQLSGGCRPVVAVIDSGVAYDHPDLDSNVIGGYDFSDGDADPYPGNNYDNPEHGTMVASIIGAETNNAQGMAGASNNSAYVMPLKVFPNAYSSVIADAINWAVANGANILNMSFCIMDAATYACADLTSNPDATIEDALQNAYNSGVISLAASGNYDDSFVGYPASSQYTIAVGATDNNNPPDRASFSNYGSNLDVVAPGIAVLGAGIPSASEPEPYLAGDGTSFSTPYAAGVMALYLSQYYAYSGGQLPDPATAASCIRSSAQDLGAAGFDVYTGMGLVRADRMLDTVNNLYGCY